MIAAGGTGDKRFGWLRIGKRPSIALRLAIGLTVGTALLWVGAAIIASLVLQKELGEAYDETLRQSAMRLLPLVVHELRETENAPIRHIPKLSGEERYLTYYVTDRLGRVIVAASDSPPPENLNKLPIGFSTSGDYRIFVLADPPSGFRIVVFERSRHRREALFDSIVTLTLPLAALIPIIVLGIWFFVRQAMRPLGRLRYDIAERGGDNLAPLSADGHPEELAPIAEAVADLLTRLRAALDAERAFAASSAHELRTPIAGALAQTQLLANELGEGPGAERVKSVEGALHHLAQLSEKLLQLARLDAGFARSDTASDLLPVLQLVVRDLNAQKARHAPVRLKLEPGIALKAPIHPDAFAIAVRNLVHNALVHGDPKKPVDVVAGPGARIRVINAGPIVPPATMERIGERFVRGATDAQGTGLGLAIVQAIMAQIGGRLTLRSPAAERHEGFEAILDLLPPDAR